MGIGPCRLGSSGVFPTSPWVVSPKDLLIFGLHVIYDLVIEGPEFCAFEAFLVQKSAFIRPYSSVVISQK